MHSAHKDFPAFHRSDEGKHFTQWGELGKVLRVKISALAVAELVRAWVRLQGALASDFLLSTAN